MNLRLKIFSILLLLMLFFAFPLDSSQEIQSQIEKTASQIWQTSGTLFPKPQIVYKDIEMDLDSIHSLIYYSTKDNKIYISRGFAEMCLSIGEEALAVALGHEIGHYFNLHKNTVSISGYYLSDNDTKLLKELSLDQRTNYLELETQADLFAAFHCYCSNYDITKAWVQLIDTMYSASKDTSIRMQIKERKKIAEFALNKIKDMLPVYKAAKFCYLIGEYEMSALCYEYLIFNNINAIEICFNLANSYSLAAINTDEKAKKFIYPFEMRKFYIYDSNFVKTGINTIERSLSKKRVDIEDFRTIMISKALLNYNYLLKSSSSPELFLAISALYNFSGETKSARAYLIQAEEKAQTEFHKNLVQLMKGLFYMNIAKDMAELELSKADDFQPAKHNLDLISYKKTNEQKSSKTIIRKNENFNGIDLVNIEEKLKVLSGLQYNLKGSLFTIKEHKYQDFTALEVMNNYGKSLFLESADSYKGKTLRDIAVGTSVEILKNKYGVPDNICFYGNSIYYIYNDLKISFEIINDKVHSWLLFLNN